MKTGSWINLPNVILFLGIILALLHVFSYCIPLTDNAFVISPVHVIGSESAGRITQIHVHSGMYIQAHQALARIRSGCDADQMAVLKAKLALTQAKLRAQNDTDPMHDTRQQSIQRAEIQYIRSRLNALCREHILYAPVSGFMQSVHILAGSDVQAHQPLFSVVDNHSVFIQANFNETDLRHIRQGQRVTILPRIYMGRKIFHGTIASNYWPVSRQIIDARTQLPVVQNENQWILMPQRLPVFIRVVDTDPRFPLMMGMSVYVYVHT